MNVVIKLIQNHKTIREFTNQKVSDETLETLFDTLMRTPTSSGLQQASIIRVTDIEKKKQISEICRQEYVARVPELIIFVADLFRNNELAKSFGEEIEKESDVDLFFQGYTDAALMAQNATLIIESLGMGAVYLGSILNESDRIIEILELPELVFPVVGIGFGYPNQEPQLKPRMDKSLRVFENTYKIEDDYKKSFKDYNKEMTTYYDLRDANQKSEDFATQVINKMKNPIKSRLKLLENAKNNKIKL